MANTELTGKDEGTERLGENGVNDITDVKNNEFVYVYQRMPQGYSYVGRITIMYKG